MLEKMVKMKEQILAEYHAYQLASQHALDRAYQANEQVEEHVVKIQEQTLVERIIWIDWRRSMSWLEYIRQMDRSRRRCYCWSIWSRLRSRH